MTPRGRGHAAPGTHPNSQPASRAFASCCSGSSGRGGELAAVRRVVAPARATGKRKKGRRQTRVGPRGALAIPTGCCYANACAYGWTSSSLGVGGHWPARRAARPSLRARGVVFLVVSSQVVVLSSVVVKPVLWVRIQKFTLRTNGSLAL